MAEEILVKGAKLTVTCDNPVFSFFLPQVDDVVTLSTIVSTELAKSEGIEIITKADIEQALQDYKPNYTTQIFEVPGTLKLNSIIIIDSLSQLVKKDGDEVAIKTTTGQMLMGVQAGATTTVTPPPVPNTDPPVMVYPMAFEVEATGQILTKSD